MNEFFDASTNNHRKREIGMNSDCCYNHGQKSLRYMKITKFFLGVNSAPYSREW